MNKVCFYIVSLLLITAHAHQVSHLNKLDSLIKQLRLKTYRAEFIHTPELLQCIITELYAIQNEFEALSVFTHQTLQNLSDTTTTFNSISEQISTLISEPQIDISFQPKKKVAKKSSSLARTVKTIEKYSVSLNKNIKNLTAVNKILQATLEELESIQNDIHSLAQTVKTLSISYHHQAKDLFLVALKLFRLAGIEDQTGPYLCQLDETYQTLDEFLK